MDEVKVNSGKNFDVTLNLFQGRKDYEIPKPSPRTLFARNQDFGKQRQVRNDEKCEGCGHVEGEKGDNIKRAAFTLSETLIALVIIGVVAALTVPVIAQHAQKREIVERLKKNYALFTEVTNKIMAEEGSPKNDWGSTINGIYNRYKQHLSIIKDCGPNAGCFPQTPYKYLTTGVTGDWDKQTVVRKLILADGTQVIFSSEVFPACASTDTYTGDNNVCTTISVDVNGERKPNQIGRDLFRFTLKQDGLHPSGCDTAQCGGMGYGCACKVLRENAINY